MYCIVFCVLCVVLCCVVLPRLTLSFMMPPSPLFPVHTSQPSLCPLPSPYFLYYPPFTSHTSLLILDSQAQPHFSRFPAQFPSPHFPALTSQLHFPALTSQLHFLVLTHPHFSASPCQPSFIKKERDVPICLPSIVSHTCSYPETMTRGEGRELEDGKKGKGWESGERKKGYGGG